MEKSELQALNTDAIDKLSSLITPLSLLPKDQLQDLPDYFGQSYTFGLEAIYDAARENNPDRLNELFPGVFIGALKAQARIRDEVIGWAEQSQILLSSEPIEDILTLSGFIKIYAELHGNQSLWNKVKDTWDNYLETAAAQEMIAMMVAMARYRDAQIGIITEKSVLRTNWDVRLRRKFEEKGIAQDSFRHNPFGQDEEPTHPSPLIRVLARNGMIMSFDARNIFFAIYLSKHPAAKNIKLEFPDRKDIENQIEHETNSETDELIEVSEND
jgi:hypothetical protein